MTGFGGGCRYEGEGVRLRYAIDIAIVPGPAALAAGGGELVVPWFVAVADPSGAILDKQIFELRTEAPQGPGPKLLVEEVEQRIAGVGPGDGPGWRVYFGFDIGAEEGLRRLRERGSRP
ncbi:MAG: hypothetical protein NZ555_00770 [Geminicoccaceae bacterium]|nr:hypothetical protein [Geminicoccaceae bacterium]MCX8099758.1 hypothetical protein [Geminicoccaceae bacterium]MDW8369160.1 hypothetical protein [Geminicoccaceae bacterium]